MKIIITGGAGFIGSHLVDALINDHNVLCIDNFSNGANINPAATYENIDIVDCNKLKQIVKLYNPDIIYHMAAIGSIQYSINNFEKVYLANVVGTLNLAEAATQTSCKKLIFSSSSSVYGGTDGISKESDVPNPLSPYAITKLHSEDILKSYTKYFDVIILRYFNVFGLRQKADGAYPAIIPAAIAAHKENSTLKIFGDGLQRRDFCNVKNIVSANILAADQDISSNTFNIGTGISHSINDIINFLNIKNVQYLESRPGDVKKSLADISKARDILNYNPIATFYNELSKLSN